MGKDTNNQRDMEEKNITVSEETRRMIGMKARMDALWEELERMAEEAGVPANVVDDAFLGLNDIYDKFFVMGVRERLAESGGTVL